MRLATLVIFVTACGATRFKTERVGAGTTGVPMALPAGAYDLAIGFWVPRAQVVQWSVTCPGVEQHGTLGESFDAYRTRRIAELRREQEDRARTTASLTGAVVGAVAPRASAGVATPDAQASVSAQVDPNAAGAAAGAAVAAQPIELAPGDVGAGKLTTIVHVRTTADGACSVQATAEDPQIAGSFDVTRIRDLVREAEQRQTIARQLRVQLSAQLVAEGADPQARARRLAAEAELRARREAAEAELRARREAEQARAHAQVQASLDAKLEVENRARAQREAEDGRRRAAQMEIDLRAQAEIDARRQAVYAAEQARLRLVLELRARLRAQLILWGADPGLRARLAAQAQAERDAREARLRLAIQVREQHEAELRAERDRREAELRAERERRLQIQLELALRARASLRAYLVMLGARERPPMPAPMPEQPGATPFAGAIWVAGRWSWEGARWQWHGGGWRDSTRFGATGGEVMVMAPAAATETVTATAAATATVPVTVTAPVTVTVTVPAPAPARVPVPAPVSATAPVRDHRSPAPPRVRDHRH